MKKQIVAACFATVLLPVAAFAADEQAAEEQKQARLAEIEDVIVTADKAQPADYKPDAKVAALLAEIAKE
jgi:hypothetical protein